jgi:hypothetical protein
VTKIDFADALRVMFIMKFVHEYRRADIILTYISLSVQTHAFVDRGVIQLQAVIN